MSSTGGETGREMLVARGSHVIVAGGGLAGMAAAAALGGAGYRVTLLEARGFLGGRATSFPLSPYEDSTELIDNCQHILLRCCNNLLDFYARLGVAGRIVFHRQFHFVEPGGRVSVLRAGAAPAPLHFAGSFLKLPFLGMRDKLGIVRAMAAIRAERNRRKDLDLISMKDWLDEKKQTAGAILRFWRPVLVSAVNEELDRMAASHGFKVFWLSFMARTDSYEMGIPAVPLGELYHTAAWKKLPNVTVHLRTPVELIRIEGGAVEYVKAGGEIWKGDYYVCAVPFERIPAVAPGLPLDLKSFDHSPITGIHLWFDRPVTDLAHAALLDRTIQWMFNKYQGKYIQLVVSASRDLVELRRWRIIETAVKELAEFFPAAREAKLERSHVIKEVRATFSAAPGLEASRPQTRTSVRSLFVAGDWTRTGWPATMEGAVRSGYMAAEAVTEAARAGVKFLLPEIA